MVDTASDSVLAGVRRVGEVVLLLVVVGSALAAVVIPRLDGAQPLAVTTGSMSPVMPPGTLVVVRPVEAADIAVGDVITFMPRENDPTVVTHRVVSIGFDMGGEMVFVTKGDANDVADPAPVREIQLVGKRWYFVPWLGYVTTFLDSQKRTVGTVLLAGGLLLYALVMFGGAALDRVRRPERPEEEAQQSEALLEVARD
ncbi:signal peptidase I [Nocardioides sp. GCM10027113]|uniref:signal peptidase I n=1 Tax=unclassified Nocardioides TaxID=2615069 RepID=UPI00360866B7